MEIDRPITIAIILFIILILVFYLILPKYQEFKGLQIKLGEREAELKGRGAYYKEIADVYTRINGNKESLEKIEMALPAGPPILAPIIYFLQKKSLENGLTLGKVVLLKRTSITPESEIKEIGFGLTLSGSYPAFKNFLTVLGESARLFEVENITFYSQPPTPEKPQKQETFPFGLTIITHSY